MPELPPVPYLPPQPFTRVVLNAEGHAIPFPAPEAQAHNAPVPTSTPKADEDPVSW